MTEIICIDCEHEFDAELWECGNCPKCGKYYYWEEYCTEDYSDCWAGVEWI